MSRGWRVGVAIFECFEMRLTLQNINVALSKVKSCDWGCNLVELRRWAQCSQEAEETSQTMDSASKSSHWIKTA
jgi:hypothetical protein